MSVFPLLVATFVLTVPVHIGVGVGILAETMNRAIYRGLGPNRSSACSTGETQLSRSPYSSGKADNVGVRVSVGTYINASDDRAFHTVNTSIQGDSRMGKPASLPWRP